MSGKTKKIIFGILFYFLNVQAKGEANVKPLSELIYYSPALTIEGSDIMKSFEFMKEKPIWANYGFVLDTPFDSEGVNHSELSESTTFELKEASIKEYNEVRSDLTTFAILNHYIEHIEEYKNEPTEDNYKILLFIHRGHSGEIYAQGRIKNFLKNYIGAELKQDSSFLLNFELKNRIEIDVRWGYDYTKIPGVYDIVVSLSLFAGLNPTYLPSSLVLPIGFQPFNLDTMELDRNKMYFELNHLTLIYKNINIEPNLVKYAFKNSQSENEKKKLVGREEKGQLYRSLDTPNLTIVFQAGKIFNPKKLPDTFILK